MHRQLIKIAGLLAVVAFLCGPVRAQSPDADAQAAARELITTMKLGDQFKAMMPMIFKAFKPAIVQNRPDVDRDFDALVPIMLDKMSAPGQGVGGCRDRGFTPAISAPPNCAISPRSTSRRPARNSSQKTPFVTQQTMAAGQKFGQTAGAEAQKEMMEQLRNKGHSL